MAMNVDPHELVGVAAALAELVRATHGGLPAGWVPPAGADPISAQYIPLLNARKEALANGVIGALNGVQPLAHHIGASAVDYTTTDDESGRVLRAGGSELVANPVAPTAPLGTQFAPIAATPTSASVDPLTLAEQLHNGPGPGPASDFAQTLRGYVDGTHSVAVQGLGAASDTLQSWTPVGATAADRLTGHRDQLDALGSGFTALADGIDGYSNAFRSARGRHPTPQEIIAARKELLAATRSKNSAAIAAAMAKFNELNARSAETFSQYLADVTASGSNTGQGKGDGSTPGSGTGTGTGGTSGNGGTSSGGNSSGGSDMLTQMLPSLISAMTSGANSLSGTNNQDTGDTYGGDGEPSYSDGSYPVIPSTVGGGGAPADAAVPGGPADDYGGQTPTTIGVGGLPMVTGTATLSPSTSLPRTSVIEPLASASPGGTATAARGATGSPMMPYMPMSPGMGGAGGGGGGERNRVVAWHPDRLMYVDNTPYTEAVIGEKPTIAPTATPPTPAPATPIPNPPGGSV